MIAGGVGLIASAVAANDAPFQPIAAGKWHTVAIKADGSLWAWGRNEWGQLGDGDGNMEGKSSPVPIGSGDRWLAVAAGLYHTVALKADGSLWAWGRNSYGQLGINFIDITNQPVQMGLDRDWRAVVAGSRHTVALKTDGSLWTWGNNEYGQLGIGNTKPQFSPVQVGTNHDWRAVAAGRNYTVALKTNGSLWAWGDNEYGQLGIGTTKSTNQPVQVGTDQDWRAVVAGFSHTMALKTNNTLWAWGNNRSGNLGVPAGYPPEEHSPVQVGASHDWQAVAAGEIYTVALKTDNTLWAWGGNNVGQLGIGSTSAQSSPVQVVTDQDWQTVTSGGSHTVALKTDGSLWVWGFNDYGQVGNGTTETQYSPTPIWPSQLPKFTNITRLPNGQIQLDVEGPTNVVYRVLGSANLLDWQEIGILTNATGSASSQDTTAPNLHRRFYRLEQP